MFGIGHGPWSAEDAGKWSYSYWCGGEIEADNLSQVAHVSGLPDTIYHLAGGSSVGVSFQNPREDFSRTVESTVELLEWMRLNAAKSRVVGVSSAAVYGAQHVENIAEDAPVSPSSPYGSHKAIMESLFWSYGENFGLQVAVVRLFSVYGAGLKKQLIWDMCCKLIADRAVSIELGGTGAEVRDWLYVSDAAKLLWFVREKCSPRGRAINGGTGIATRVSEIANMICRAWGASPVIEFSGMARDGDPPNLVADIAKARELGFQPAVKLEDGIFETVAWFKRNWGQSSDA